MTWSVILLTSLLLFPSGVAAHTLFIRVDNAQPHPDGTLSILLRNGSFWASEAAMRQDRLADLTLVGPEGSTSGVDRSPWRVVDKDVLIDIPIEREGTYLLGAAARASIARLPAEDFNRYLRNEGLKDQRGSREDLGESEIAVSERYTKFAKTIFQVGPVTTDSFQTVLNHKVEIVPQVNPGSLQVGDAFKARIYFDGEPLAGERVFANSDNGQSSTPQEGPVEALELISADDGGIEFEVTEPGLWYVRFIRLERLGDSEYWYSDLLVWLGLEDPRVPYQSYWATLTFRIP